MNGGNAFFSRLQGTLNGVVSNLRAKGIHERHLLFGGQGTVPTRKPTVPTNARSEFLANRAMGDWAERLLADAIGQACPEWTVSQYGDTNRIAAGHPDFKASYLAGIERTRQFGKRPDLLLFPANVAVASDLSAYSRVETEEVVQQAVAAVEVRSSKFDALTYIAVRKRQRDAGRSTGRETPSFTVKVEDLVIVYRWLERNHVPESYCQVFFDSAFVIDPAFIARAVRDSQCLIAIDGYHGFMAIPTDLGSIAERVFYLAGGYKYAMAGEGVCFLHCPPGYCPRPRDTGWYAGFSALEQGGEGVPYAPDGSRFFGATFDVSGLYRFNAVQDWLLREGLGVVGMLGHVRELERSFLSELDRVQAPLNAASLVVSDERRRGRFLAFRTPEAGTIAERLAAEDIIVDHRGDRLRIGFGIYHDENDAARLAHVLARSC